jgi:hypothetical protein
MKKITTIISAAAFLTVLAFSSCKKDHTCECTITDSSGILPTQTTSGTVNGTKKDAEEACEKGNTTVGTISTSCKLK